jgi:hypothetical protein
MHISAYLMPLLFAGIFATASHSGMSSQPDGQKSSLEDSLTGNWTGTSTCQVKNSSCRDENVVFHIAPGKAANQYRVRADKIVDGRMIDMGDLDFTINRATQTLTCASANGTWVLVVNKRRIEGTLTTSDNVLFRKLSLSKAW